MAAHECTVTTQMKRKRQVVAVSQVGTPSSRDVFLTIMICTVFGLGAFYFCCGLRAVVVWKDPFSPKSKYYGIWAPAAFAAFGCFMGLILGSPLAGALTLFYTSLDELGEGDCTGIMGE